MYKVYSIFIGYHIWSAGEMVHFTSKGTDITNLRTGRTWNNCQPFLPLPSLKIQHRCSVCLLKAGWGWTANAHSRTSESSTLICLYEARPSIQLSLCPHIMHQPIEIQMETPKQNSVYPTSGKEMCNIYVFPAWI